MPSLSSIFFPGTVAAAGDNVVGGTDDTAINNLLSSGRYGRGQGWEVVVIAPPGSRLPPPNQ